MRLFPLLFKTTLSNIPRIILRLEWVWIAVMILAFWHRSPPIRDQWVFLLAFAVPIYLSRWHVHRRLWTRTPLDILLIGFAILTAFNFVYAPLSRASYWVLVCRPFLGFFIIWYFAEHARQHGHIRYLIVATIGLGLSIGGLALVASQWQVSGKSEIFDFIIRILPMLDHRQILPDMQLSFNPNEVAGALVYFCPFLLGVALGTFVTDRDTNTSRWHRILDGFIRWSSLLGFIMTFTALFLGQSRFGLAGVFVALAWVIVFSLPNWTYRAIGLSLLGIFVIVEIMIVTNVLPLDFSTSASDATVQTDNGAILDERDERTFSTRFDLWERALRMVRDYPLTGAGMSTYRAFVMREEYIIPYYEEQQSNPPHAHNAFLQLGADLGVLGLMMFVGWYGTVMWMAYSIYSRQILNSTIMTIAITGSILAYIGYGIGDTVTLWDRFAFLHWWFIALMVALFVRVQFHSSTIIHRSDGLQIQT